MKLLVIGSGGREHALVWKLAQSPHVTQLWCAPANAGIAEERLVKNGAPVEGVNIGAEDLPALLAFALEKQADLTVVGPDNPLALGIVDLFQQHGLRIWGVNRKAAQFESSLRPAIAKNVSPPSIGASIGGNSRKVLPSSSTTGSGNSPVWLSTGRWVESP